MLVGFPSTGTAAPSQSGGAKAKSTKSTSQKRYSAARSKSRRAKLARARAAAAAREARELATPQFKRDEAGELVPDIRAEAAIIYNPITDEVLWEANSQDPRSIASITKVMTAIVFLEAVPDLTQIVVIDRSDTRAASTTYLKSRQRVTAESLLHLLLIGSDNAAARALARISPLGSAGFIDRMNEKAIELGLSNTRFADPSGLDARNVSSAYDISRLIAYASGNERISPIMRMPVYAFTPAGRRAITVHNTNRLLGGDVDVRGGKTGFIRQAGYCLATLLRLPQGDQVAVVVLGARSNAGRFMETRHLVNWLASKAPQFFPSQPQREQ